MPINFKQLGAKEEDIPYLAHTCCYGDGSGSGVLYGFTKLEEQDVVNIYKLML